MTIIVDTSGLLAAFDTDEPKHAECAEMLADGRGPFVMSPLVLAEIDFMVGRRLGVESELMFLADVRQGAYELADVTDDDIADAVDVVRRYRDLNIGITDAVNVVLADRHTTTRLLTLDERHYRAVRPLSGGDTFTLLPADA